MQNNLAADVDSIRAIAVVPVILDMVCRVTGMGFAAVARVTGDRWIACSVRDDISFGLGPGDELDIETTICREVHADGNPVVFDSVADDPVYSSYPVPRLHGFQSYISVPIRRRDGQFFGTLCAIDPRPAIVNNADTLAMFGMFAELIAFHLEAQERLQQGRAALLDARQTLELRDQFIAVLGHDLRNPLSSVASGLRLMEAEPLTWKGRRVLWLMWGSVERLTKLTANILDLARGRLGDGIPVTRMPSDLSPVLKQVVRESQAGRPDRRIDLVADLTPLVFCDEGRVAQLVTSLLDNALVHGDGTRPVTVNAATHADRFELTVTNFGVPIAPQVMAELFKPFVRGGTATGGLGLGLYVAAEIAHTHGGTLTATSGDEITSFTVKLPLAAD